MYIGGISDVTNVIIKHIEDIDREVKSDISSEVKAALLAAKSEALKALAEVYKR